MNGCACRNETVGCSACNHPLCDKIDALTAEVARLRAERDAAEERFRGSVARNIELASAMEDVTICLEEDHPGNSDCCCYGECEWARSIRVARALLSPVTPEPR
jgi:phosphosulfolactate phosphohydrolase-like enzyme